MCYSFYQLFYYTLWYIARVYEFASLLSNATAAFTRYLIYFSWRLPPYTHWLYHTRPVRGQHGESVRPVPGNTVCPPNKRLECWELRVDRVRWARIPSYIVYTYISYTSTYIHRIYLLYTIYHIIIMYIIYIRIYNTSVYIRIYNRIHPIYLYHILIYNHVIHHYIII